MPISLTCPSCGAGYRLKDELAGRKVRCPKCQAAMSVPALEDLEEVPLEPLGTPAGQPRQAAAHTGLHRAFQGDTYIFRAQLAFHSDKQVILNEDREKLLTVDRPSQTNRGCLALIAAVVLLVVTFGVSVNVSEALGIKDKTAFPFCFLLSIAAGIAGWVLVKPRRPATFHDAATDEKVLELVDRGRGRFDVIDAKAGMLAQLRSGRWSRLFRIRVQCRNPQGEVLAVAGERSMSIALFARYLPIVRVFLRSKLEVLAPNTEGELESAGDLHYAVGGGIELTLRREGGARLDPRLAIPMCSLL